MGAGTNGGQAASGVGGNQPRDFTPDDFPALGGQTSHQQQPSQSNADSHPPGLNGFQQHGDQQHRQSLLGSLTGGQTPSQQQPGLLNLGQARNVHPGFQVDAEKQRVRILLVGCCVESHFLADLRVKAEPKQPYCCASMGLAKRES